MLSKVGVQLLAAQKPLQRGGWWKGKFALSWWPATGAEAGGPQFNDQLPLLTITGQELFWVEGGATCRDRTAASHSPPEVGHAVV